MDSVLTVDYPYCFTQSFHTLIPHHNSVNTTKVTNHAHPLEVTMNTPLSLSRVIPKPKDLSTTTDNEDFHDIDLFHLDKDCI